MGEHESHRSERTVITAAHFLQPEQVRQSKDRKRGTIAENYAAPTTQQYSGRGAYLGVDPGNDETYMDNR